MSLQEGAGWTYADLSARFPEDHVRRELIRGELFVTPSPDLVHQRVVRESAFALLDYSREHGGEVILSPMDVIFSETDVLQPDVLFFTAGRVGEIGGPRVTGVPDLVVEVASASTRGHDLLRKRDVYERYGVSEYWFVDLEAQRVEVFRLRGDDRRRYGDPQLVSRNQSYETNLLPSFTLDVGQILPESTS